MEITVQGKGESFYTPDQVIITLTFSTKEISYESALEKGSANVLEFIQTILLHQGFKKEDMKTDHFLIRKETKYNKETATYDFIGYSYNQSATLKFDYDRTRLSTMMDEIAHMTNPPFYNVDFTVKDVEACKKENLARAYKDAERKAECIAEAAGKVLKTCVKTDFKPFTTEYISRGYESEMLYESVAKKKMGAELSTAQTINSIFTPKDVCIVETLYCLWIAE